MDGSVDPARDIETIQTELVLADMETVAKRLEKAQHLLKNGDKKYADEVEAAQIVLEHLNGLKPARTAPLTKDQKAIVDGWFLLTTKKVVYAANISENDVGEGSEELPMVQKVKQIAAEEGSEVLVICAKLEEEIAQLEPEEKQMFLDEMGIGKSGLDRLVTLELHAARVRAGERRDQAGRGRGVFCKGRQGHDTGQRKGA